MHLLEYLREQCKLDYLSDLPLTYCWKSVLPAIEPSDFPLEEWNDAVRYLCKLDTSFSAAEEAKQFLEHC